MDKQVSNTKRNKLLRRVNTRDSQHYQECYALKLDIV